MERRKIESLENRLKAIIARDRGMSYSQVLEEFNLTPAQFSRTVIRELPSAKRIFLEFEADIGGIVSNEKRKTELFDMGEDFLVAQYKAVREKRQSRLYEGTLKHPQNIRTLVYHAIVSQAKTLESPKLLTREEAIRIISTLPKNLLDYFDSLNLNGLAQIFKGKKNRSPTAILEEFDEEYQRRTGDTSLFDLSQDNHLHPWGDKFQVSRDYWKNPDNVEIAIKHILREIHPELYSDSRREVISEIETLPENLEDYFKRIGLSKMLYRGFRENRGSPWAILKLIDSDYQRRTGDASLFDLSQDNHLHPWGHRFKAPQGYLKIEPNVETAVYHILTENCPELKETDREKLISYIRRLPRKLAKHFNSFPGFQSIMVCGFEDGEKLSPRAVLKKFDRVYQRITGNKSLFDQTQDNYLEFNSHRELIRTA